jgi:hypothetical protein
LTSKANEVNLVNLVRGQYRQCRQWGQCRPNATRPPQADAALALLATPPGGGHVFDGIDGVDKVDCIDSGQN